MKPFHKWKLWQQFLACMVAGTLYALLIALAFEYFLGLLVIVFGTPTFIAEALKGSDMSDKS